MLGRNLCPVPKRLKENVANCRSPLDKLWDTRPGQQPQGHQAQGHQAVTTLSTQLPLPVTSPGSGQPPWTPQELLIPQSATTTFPSAAYQNPNFPGSPFTYLLPQPSTFNTFGGLTSTMSPSSNYPNNHSQLSQDMASNWYSQDYAISNPQQPQQMSQPQVVNMFHSSGGAVTSDFIPTFDSSRYNSVSPEFARRTTALEYDRRGNYWFVIGSVSLVIAGVRMPFSSYARFYVAETGSFDLLVGHDLHQEMLARMNMAGYPSA